MVNGSYGLWLMV